ALSGLAVPADREIAHLLRLDAVDGVEHHHAVRDLNGIVAELAGFGVAAPDSECCLLCRHCPSSRPRSVNNRTKMTAKTAKEPRVATGEGRRGATQHRRVRARERMR